MNKLVLDATCGFRGIWFDKRDRRAVFVDRRRERHECTYEGVRRLYDIAPDILASFTDLPFPDESFWHVVFDPPHIVDGSGKAMIVKEYGSLDSSNWREVIRAGFCECWRVLRPGGTLIFKWAEVQISVREIAPLFPAPPLYGHKSGRAARTHWIAFVKPIEPSAPAQKPSTHTHEP